jgi:hypothetical protein
MSSNAKKGLLREFAREFFQLNQAAGNSSCEGPVNSFVTYCEERIADNIRSHGVDGGGMFLVLEDGTEGYLSTPPPGAGSGLDRGGILPVFNAPRHHRMDSMPVDNTAISVTKNPAKGN